MYRYPHGYYDGGLVRTAICPTITISSFEANNFIAEIKDNDMRQRDFHRHCRVVYRAMRKQYGVEKVQDECLRVFKVVFPFLHRARKGEDCRFDDLAVERTRRIFESWNPVSGSELDILLGNVLGQMQKPMGREEFIAFCEDIMVVCMRIRKLSVREAGRLMDCDEKTLDIMLNCGISKSALYRAFGNSIVISCLFHIFRKLFIETEPDVVKGEATQLSLF